MIDVLAYVVMGLALVGTAWGIATGALNKAPGQTQIVFAALVALVTVVQSVIAGVKLALGYRPDELATTIGYLIGIVFLVPVAGLWALSERTRYSGYVLSVAAFAVLGMTLRLQVLWGAGA